MLWQIFGSIIYKYIWKDRKLDFCRKLLIGLEQYIRQYTFFDGGSTNEAVKIDYRKLSEF